MRVTKTELYDRYYSVYPDKAKLYRGDTEMPNHCHNRVTFYPSGNNTDSSLDQIETIKDIFKGESVFTQIIPEPDWENTPLMSSDMPKYDWDKAKGKLGELPQMVETPYGLSLRFVSTDKQDDRWYDWRVQNWDTKWDAYDVVVTDEDPEYLEVEFNTAWSPPEAICHKIREDFPDIAISWFYDEPGCEIAGYL
tara:strand:+ start:46 stop:627 length:582 start_codon:yes stop_codon:yes gene_type:complete